LSAPRKEIDGSELGTYGSRLLTERYLGDDIALESHDTDGTTFTVSYPCGTVEDSSD
jgi:signal transduction histidine kinase